jgi:hypothetical protein
VAEKIKVDLEDNSPHRVALELARTIAHCENKTAEGDRKYWLELYYKCRRVVVSGNMPE